MHFFKCLVVKQKDIKPEPYSQKKTMSSYKLDKKKNKVHKFYDGSEKFAVENMYVPSE